MALQFHMIADIAADRVVNQDRDAIDQHTGRNKLALGDHVVFLRRQKSAGLNR